MSNQNRISRLRLSASRASLLRGTASAAALFATGMLAATAAYAQGGTDVEQVVVTGSRIGTPGFVTPTPVTEISPLQYEVKQVSTVNEIIADIPSLTPNQAQSSVTDVGASNFSLRNLSSVRTLTLMNGLRTQATSVNGGFDVNVLPASLIQHVDIVTGGASAAYGSDAVAGVVNITLNTTLTGLRAKVGGGESYYGDDQTLTASAAWGEEFAGGRGHIVLGGDFYRQNGISQQNKRPWGRLDWGIIPDPNCNVYSTTCTNLYLTTNVISASMNDGGVITSGPLKGITFGSGGVLQPYVYGQYASGNYMIGGSGARENETQSLMPTTGRTNLLMHTSYDFSDDVSAWVQMSYARSTQYYPIIPQYDSAAITITNQNPFIPTALASMMTASKVTSFVMGRTNVDIDQVAQGRDLLYGRNEDYDPSAGLKGKFNAIGTDWSWDVNAQYSSHEYLTIAKQNRSTARWNLAVDAVANPATGGVAGVPTGQAVCRSTLTNPTNGCVPVNLFGPNTITSAVTSYVMGTSFIDAIMTMSDASANLKGQPFSTWAGPVAVAVGGEYRRQTTASTTDPGSQALDWKNANANPYKGNYSVEEGYLELDVPLLKDSPIGKLLDLDTAVRATSYSNSGGVTTWKVGLNYSVTDDIRLRATRSHDIRAPNLQDLYQTGVLRTGSNIINPKTGVNATAQGLTSGNPNLVPEIGDTITGGVVYSPSWLDGFNVSIDYWHIKLTNQIITPQAQQIVNNCLQFNIQSYCPAIQYNAQGVISVVASQGFNAASLQTDGWDFEVGYNFAMSDIVSGWGGTVQFHALGTLLGNYTTNQFGVINNTAGSVGNGTLARVRANLNAIYINDPWTVSITGNLEGGGPLNSLYNETKYTYAQGARTINNNIVADKFYVNLSVSYQVTEAWQLYGRVTNLFGVAPPILPDTTTFQHVTGNNSLYDRVGGQFLVGVKLSLD